MTTLPGGWQEQGAWSGRLGAATPGQHVEEAAPISAQRCLPITGARVLATERRCAARTQLGMPAFAPPTGEPPSSAGERRAPAAGAGLVRAPARRGPPPLPARFAVPKVVIRSAPVPPGTIPARRLQLQDVTSELDGADLPPVTPRSLATQAPGGSAGASSRSAATNGGRQGMLTALLVRLLSLLAPSLQLQRAPREDRSTASRRRR